MSKRPSPIEYLIAKAISNNISRRRKELNLSQEAVANAAGIDRNHYQVIESGRSDRKTNHPLNPRLNTLFAISKVLDCTVIDLLEDAVKIFQKYRDDDTMMYGEED